MSPVNVDTEDQRHLLAKHHHVAVALSPMLTQTSCQTKAKQMQFVKSSRQRQRLSSEWRKLSPRCGDASPENQPRKLMSLNSDDGQQIDGLFLRISRHFHLNNPAISCPRRVMDGRMETTTLCHQRFDIDSLWNYWIFFFQLNNLLNKLLDNYTGDWHINGFSKWISISLKNEWNFIILTLIGRLFWIWLAGNRLENRRWVMATFMLRLMEICDIRFHSRWAAAIKVAKPQNSSFQTAQSIPFEIFSKRNAPIRLTVMSITNNGNRNERKTTSKMTICPVSIALLNQWPINWSMLADQLTIANHSVHWTGFVFICDHDSQILWHRIRSKPSTTSSLLDEGIADSSITQALVNHAKGGHHQDQSHFVRNRCAGPPNNDFKFSTAAGYRI